MNCIGNSATALIDNYCLIALSTLTESPYSLILNESIYAQVLAQNFYGDSPISIAGNGGEIKLVPDAPISLVNDASFTTATTIRFTWS